MAGLSVKVSIICQRILVAIPFPPSSRKLIAHHLPASRTIYAIFLISDFPDFILWLFLNLFPNFSSYSVGFHFYIASLFYNRRFMDMKYLSLFCMERAEVWYWFIIWYWVHVLSPPLIFQHRMILIAVSKNLLFPVSNAQ